MSIGLQCVSVYPAKRGEIWLFSLRSRYRSCDAYAKVYFLFRDGKVDLMASVGSGEYDVVVCFERLDNPVGMLICAVQNVLRLISASRRGGSFHSKNGYA